MNLIVYAFVLLGVYVHGQERPIAATLSASNGGRFGDWGTTQMCPPKTYVNGFRQKVHRPCGAFCDDTASNGVELACADPDKPSDVQATVSSTVGPLGDWTPWKYCVQDSYIVSFRHDLEPYGGAFNDDTKTNNINVRCRSMSHGGLSELTGDSPAPWGTNQAWSGQCPDNSAVCGIRTKVEPQHSPGDNTALNDLRMVCCTDI